MSKPNKQNTSIEGKIDKECVNLCRAMNKLPGISTIESCCGHGKHQYHIWFEATNLDVLPELLYWFDSCHCGYYGWNIQAKTDCAMSPVVFFVEGPTGAYEEAEKIAELINKYVKDREKE